MGLSSRELVFYPTVRRKRCWAVTSFCVQFDYLRKIDLVYDGADSISLNWFNEVLYKLRYYSMHVNLIV